MRLVEGWKKAYRWFSVQALALIAFIPLLADMLPTVWVSIPEDLRAVFEPSTALRIAQVIAVLGLVGRLIKQRDP
jgi:hypothetical protein